jgi:cytochrome b561
MNWRNSTERYGLAAVLLHWLVALAVAGLFPLGLWMTGLDYYDPWYRQGPDLHKGIGVLLFMVLLLRLGWRLWSPPPEPLENHSRIEKIAAHLVHRALYLLLFLIMVSGYLISTADGRPLAVFGWFEIPALIAGVEGQEDVAGRVHLILALTLVACVALHVAGALKHHFIDRDRTLLRMFGR